MIRTLIARTLIVATIAAGGFSLAGTAFAEPTTGGDSGGMGACPVVNTDDSGKETTTYVPHGTKLMGLTCKDGTWVDVRAVRGAAAGTVLTGRVATSTLRG
jgi:hypothetical protein